MWKKKKKAFLMQKVLRLSVSVRQLRQWAAVYKGGHLKAIGIWLVNSISEPELTHVCSGLQLNIIIIKANCPRILRHITLFTLLQYISFWDEGGCPRSFLKELNQNENFSPFLKACKSWMNGKNSSLCDWLQLA